jgi:hypothetical protein
MKMKNDDSGDGAVAELHTRCRIIPTQKDLDALVFTIELGPMSIICIANIPEEGSMYAPVYVKFKFFENSRRAKHGGNPRFTVSDDKTPALDEDS